MPLQVVYETHSTTTDNEQGIATGWQPGRLSPTGRLEAAELGRRRRDDGIDLVLCSDLGRAVETCELAFAGAALPVRHDPRLRECDYGELTGGPVEVVHGQRAARVDTPYPGGQSFRQVTAGIRALLEELRRDYDGGRVLLVGTSATRFALDHLLTGRPLESAVTAPFTWRPGWEYVLDDSWPVLDVLDGPATLAVAEELGAVYQSAFSAPPYRRTAADARRFVAEQLPAHATRAGFRCAVLRVDEGIAGFAYCYTGEPGQWWTDQVSQRAPAEIVVPWLGGHLELVELAVRPDVQGRGYATALHDALLLGVPHKRALLTTAPGDFPAARLYRRLGWQLLHPRVFEVSDLWGLDLEIRSPLSSRKPQ